jgi:gliding motility-associated-like protein
MSIPHFFFGLMILMTAAVKASAQNYTPVAVTGFNHDIFAESGTNAQAVTDTALDATNHIMYTQAFASGVSISGGLPDNGLLNNAAGNHQFQLAPYTGSNALTAMRNGTRSLTLSTPASYAKLSLLAFSAENASTITVSVNFSDGSGTTYLTNYSLSDWFFATTNVASSGFGRIARLTTTPYTVDGYPNDPRFYYADISLSCADQQKLVRGITVTNTTTAGSNAPFPNAVVLALAGVSGSQTITSSSTPATCGQANGTATVSITGTSGPWTVSWNTTPTQTGLTATSLLPTNWTASITNAFGCTVTQFVNVANSGSGTATATATPSTICAGASSNLVVTSSGSSISSATWNPGSLSGASVSVTPANTTPYTVTGFDGNGCAFSASVTVNVSTPPSAPAASGTTVCAGSTATLTITSPVAGQTYNWYDVATGGAASGTGTSFTTPVLNANTTYYVNASVPGCAVSARTPVVVSVVAAPAAPTANGVAVCTGNLAGLGVTNAQPGLTYTWYTAAAGGAPVATGVSYTVSVPATVTYYVQANSGSCPSPTRTPVTATLTPVPPDPIVTPVSICSGQTATLTVTNAQPGFTYNWSLSGAGAFIATGTSYTTPVLTSNANYFVATTTSNGCLSNARPSFLVTVNTAPTQPVIPGTTICSGSPATLTIQNAEPGATYNWWSAPNAGSILYSGSIYTVPSVLVTTTFYVDGFANGCMSGRTIVTITIAPAPAVPVVNDATICSGNTATLTVQSPVAGVTYTWYASAAGGTALATGTSFTTPALFSNTTYYVEAASGGCVNATRDAAAVTVEILPAAPLVTTVAICSGGTATVSVQTPVSGITYSWYATATGGTALATGSSYTTPVLATATTYYAGSVSAAGCSSGSRTPVPVAVNATPATPSAAGTTICADSSTTLTVQNPITGLTYSWHDALTGGNILATGLTFSTPFLSSAATYYLQSGSGTCVSPRSGVPVNLFVRLNAPVAVATPTANGVLFSWNVVAGAIAYSVSVNGGPYGPPSSGATGTSHMVTGITPGQTATLVVRALSIDGCASSAPSDPVTAGLSADDVFVPNVFTPNGDGRNDILLVFGSAIASMEFHVFDQWGNEVFRSTDHTIGWDGRYKGQRMPLGVYAFVLRAVLFDGKIISKKGSVNLLR